MQDEIICIYHGNCADGFTAAWVLNNYIQGYNIKFVPATYGTTPPDVTGKTVYILDFSYKRDVMKKIIEQAYQVIILDHHKSAEADLKGLDEEYPNVELVFDMERSGARITLDYFDNGTLEKLASSHMISLVNYVQDRDLWKFELPHTKEFTVALFSLSYEFINWDYAASHILELIEEGKAILRKHDKDIQELTRAKNIQCVELFGFVVPIINVPYMYGSDACNILAKNQPFAMYYYDQGNRRYFGLRSAPDGEDVSKIAEKFGGGGHKHAAGFSVELEDAPCFQMRKINIEDVYVQDSEKV
jgi:uncharacterized protein